MAVGINILQLNYAIFRENVKKQNSYDDIACSEENTMGIITLIQKLYRFHRIRGLTFHSYIMLGHGEA